MLYLVGVKFSNWGMKHLLGRRFGCRNSALSWTVDARVLGGDSSNERGGGDPGSRRGSWGVLRRSEAEYESYLSTAVNVYAPGRSAPSPRPRRVHMQEGRVVGLFIGTLFWVGAEATLALSGGPRGVSGDGGLGMRPIMTQSGMRSGMGSGSGSAMELASTVQERAKFRQPKRRPRGASFPN